MTTRPLGPVLRRSGNDGGPPSHHKTEAPRGAAWEDAAPIFAGGR